MKQFDLETALLHFSRENTSCCWMMRDSFEGTGIFGGIGSGKTTGSGRFLATKFLLNGYGGLVLCAKHDEKDLWVQYCKETGRLHDIIVLEPGGKYHFNFLEYESNHSVGAFPLPKTSPMCLKPLSAHPKKEAAEKVMTRFGKMRWIRLWFPSLILQNSLTEP